MENLIPFIIYLILIVALIYEQIQFNMGMKQIVNHIRKYSLLLFFNLLNLAILFMIISQSVNLIFQSKYENIRNTIELLTIILLLISYSLFFRRLEEILFDTEKSYRLWLLPSIILVIWVLEYLYPQIIITPLNDSRYRLFQIILSIFRAILWSATAIFYIKVLNLKGDRYNDYNLVARYFRFGIILMFLLFGCLSFLFNLMQIILWNQSESIIYHLLITENVIKNFCLIGGLFYISKGIFTLFELLINQTQTHPYTSRHFP